MNYSTAPCTKCASVSEYTLRLPRDGELTLGGRKRALVMGILNLTPDSFADDGFYNETAAAIARAAEMVAQGADIIDIGGESTRPGSHPVPSEEQIARTVPVIEKLASKFAQPLSIDTTSAIVARRAIEAGARIVNDISALRADPEMAGVVADAGVPVVLMHMLGRPKTMQVGPSYADVAGEVCAFLQERIAVAAANGIPHSQIIIDPGFGFGKTLEHNLELLRRLGDMTELDAPIMIGTSRKSMIGMILDRPPAERIFGTAATLAAALERGASIVRVHDVAAAVDITKVTAAIQGRLWN